MKFIHIADVHWGARPEREQTFGMIREQEIKETFQRVIDHANKQQVDLLLIAGDLFDQPPTQQELRDMQMLNMILMPYFFQIQMQYLRNHKLLLQIL